MYKSKTSLLKSNVAVHPFKPVLAVIVPVVAPAEPESNAIISMSPLPASADEGTVIFETTWQLYCVRKDGRWDAYGLGSGVGGWTNPGITFPFGDSVSVVKGYASAPGELWEEWSTEWYFEVTGGSGPDTILAISNQNAPAATSGNLTVLDANITFESDSTFKKFRVAVGVGAATMEARTAYIVLVDANTNIAAYYPFTLTVTDVL